MSPFVDASMQRSSHCFISGLHIWAPWLDRATDTGWIRADSAASPKKDRKPEARKAGRKAPRHLQGVGVAHDRCPQSILAPDAISLLPTLHRAHPGLS